MKCRNRVLLLPLVLILAVALVVPAALAQQRRLVTIASGWVVGVYYPLAGAMSRIVYKVKDLNLRATVESSGASVANAQLIGTGDADFALLQNDIAFYAYNGVTLSAFKDKPIKNMGAVFTIYPELVHVVVTKASGVKVPANTYKDQSEATTVAVMAMMVARSDLPEDLVYKFTKAIFDDLKQFHAAHSAAQSLTLETALSGNPIPLHPGAARFYKEKGILK